MFIINIRRPTTSLDFAAGIVVVGETKDELREELKKLNIYDDIELEWAVDLAREVGKL